MSEQPAPGGADGQQPQQPPLVVNAQYVRDLSFETPNAPGIFTEMRGAGPEISVGVDVQANVFDQANKVYEVRLKLNAEGKLGDKTAFIAELDYGAAVTINAPDDQVSPLLMVEAPRLMFPFARNILAEVTREGGFAPVVLQPIDFVALFRQRLQAYQQARQQQAAESGGAGAGGGNGAGA